MAIGIREIIVPQEPPLAKAQCEEFAKSVLLRIAGWKKIAARLHLDAYDRSEEETIAFLKNWVSESGNWRLKSFMEACDHEISAISLDDPRLSVDNRREIEEARSRQEERFRRAYRLRSTNSPDPDFLNNGTRRAFTTAGPRDVTYKSQPLIGDPDHQDEDD